MGKASCTLGRVNMVANVKISSCNCICKDHSNEIEAPDAVVKDLISYKIMKRFDKKARLINGTETTMFVKISVLINLN